MPAQPIPPGPRLRPYLVCSDAKAAIEFYRGVFGLEVEMCLEMPDGRVGHAQLKLPELWLYLSDPFPEMNIKSPKDLGGTAVSLALYVEDVDGAVARAVNAGAEVERPAEDAFHGHRTAVVVDPFGHRWMLQAQLEALTTEEIVQRFKSAHGGS